MPAIHLFISALYARVYVLLVHGQVTIIFLVSVGLFVCLSVCLSVCLCKVFLSRL